MNSRPLQPEASSGTVRALFKLAMEAERQAFLFYEALSRGFATSPDVAAFWQGMMEDELNHISLLCEIADALPSSVLSRPADVQTLNAAQRVAAYLGELRLRSIRDLHDACDAAHDKEDSEINHLFLLLAQEFISLDDRRAFYSSEIRDHQAKLSDFSRAHRARRGGKNILFASTSQKHSATQVPGDER
jgi:rubrerythrin